MEKGLQLSQLLKACDFAKVRAKKESLLTNKGEINSNNVLATLSKLYEEIEERKFGDMPLRPGIYLTEGYAPWIIPYPEEN